MKENRTHARTSSSVNMSLNRKVWHYFPVVAAKGAKTFVPPILISNCIKCCWCGVVDVDTTSLYVINKKCSVCRCPVSCDGRPQWIVWHCGKLSVVGSEPKQPMDGIVCPCSVVHTGGPCKAWMEGKQSQLNCANRRIHVCWLTQSTSITQWGHSKCCHLMMIFKMSSLNDNFYKVVIKWPQIKRRP